jgi:hypothetical protein
MGEKEFLVTRALFLAIRCLGIVPHVHLKDVLTRLPKMIHYQIPEVTQEAWAKARL